MDKEAEKSKTAGTNVGSKAGSDTAANVELQFADTAPATSLVVSEQQPSTLAQPAVDTDANLLQTVTTSSENVNADPSCDITFEIGSQRDTSAYRVLLIVLAIVVISLAWYCLGGTTVKVQDFGIVAAVTALCSFAAWRLKQSITNCSIGCAPAGLRFSDEFKVKLLGRMNREWRDLETVQILSAERSQTISWKNQKEIVQWYVNEMSGDMLGPQLVLLFKSGGGTCIPLRFLRKQQGKRLFLAIKQWAPQAALADNVLQLANAFLLDQKLPLDASQKTDLSAGYITKTLLPDTAACKIALPIVPAGEHEILAPYASSRSARETTEILPLANKQRSNMRRIVALVIYYAVYYLVIEPLGPVAVWSFLSIGLGILAFYSLPSLLTPTHIQVGKQGLRFLWLVSKFGSTSTPWLAWRQVSGLSDGKENTVTLELDATSFKPAQGIYWKVMTGIINNSLSGLVKFPNLGLTTDCSPNEADSTRLIEALRYFNKHHES